MSSDLRQQPNSPRAHRTLYSLLKDGEALGVIDEVLALLVEREVPVDPHLSRLAVQLCTKSEDRNPVKIGIALLGVFQLKDHAIDAGAVSTR